MNKYPISHNPDEPVYFFPSEEIFEKAQIIFEQQKRELEALLPEVDIQHVGSCAIPGAWGKFDIDINIRVHPTKFQHVIDIMKQHYTPKRPDVWAEGFVAFCNNKDYPIDLVVTAINSRYDDFYRVRDALITRPELLKEYNDIKQQYNGRLYKEYSEAKKKFLGGNGNIRFLKY